MLHHQTDNPAHRAEHIAAKELQVEHDWADWTERVHAANTVYEQCLREFAEEDELEAAEAAEGKKDAG